MKRFDPKRPYSEIHRPPGKGVPAVLFKQGAVLFTEDGAEYVEPEPPTPVEDAESEQAERAAALSAPSRPKRKRDDDDCGIVATVIAADYVFGGWEG